MHDPTPLTPRQRLLRLAGGIAMIVGSIVVFQVSARLDPANRAAVVSIVMLVVGTGWLGQAARGHAESSTLRETRGDTPPLAHVTPVPPDRAAIGFVAAWLLPGAGHWLIGRRKKAVLYFATITATFLVGIALAQGRNFNYEQDSVYFLAYMFSGIESGLAWLLTSGLERNDPIRFYQLGFLYSAVACLLNVVAMMDFVSSCTRGIPAEPPIPEEIAS